jgi:hypothetical protein
LILFNCKERKSVIVVFSCIFLGTCFVELEVYLLCIYCKPSGMYGWPVNEESSQKGRASNYWVIWPKEWERVEKSPHYRSGWEIFYEIMYTECVNWEIAPWGVVCCIEVHLFVCNNLLSYILEYLWRLSSIYIIFLFQVCSRVLRVASIDQ